MNKTLIRALALVSIIWNVCLPNDTSAEEQIKEPYYPQLNFTISLLKHVQNAEPHESIYKLKSAQTHRIENKSVEFTSANKIYVSTSMKIW